MNVEGRRFRVAGLFHSGNPFVDGGVVLPLRTVQGIASRPGDVTTFGVTGLDNADSGGTQQVEVCQCLGL